MSVFFLTLARVLLFVPKFFITFVTIAKVFITITIAVLYIFYNYYLRTTSCIATDSSVFLREEKTMLFTTDVVWAYLWEIYAPQNDESLGTQRGAYFFIL